MSLFCDQQPLPVLPVRYGIIYLPDKPETGKTVNRMQNGTKPENKTENPPFVEMYLTHLWKGICKVLRQQTSKKEKRQWKTTFCK